MRFVAPTLCLSDQYSRWEPRHVQNSSLPMIASETGSRRYSRNRWRVSPSKLVISIRFVPLSLQKTDRRSWSTAKLIVPLLPNGLREEVEWGWKEKKIKISFK